MFSFRLHTYLLTYLLNRFLFFNARVYFLQLGAPGFDNTARQHLSHFYDWPLTCLTTEGLWSASIRGDKNWRHNWPSSSKDFIFFWETWTDILLFRLPRLLCTRVTNGCLEAVGEGTSRKGGVWVNFIIIYIGWGQQKRVIRTTMF